MNLHEQERPYTFEKVIFIQKIPENEVFSEKA